MWRPLFVASQNNLNVLLLVQRIENLQDHAAGKREYGLDPFPLQAFDKDLSAGEFHNGFLQLRDRSSAPENQSIQYQTLRMVQRLDSPAIIRKFLKNQ
jgi:hypothetical protein